MPAPKDRTRIRALAGSFGEKARYSPPAGHDTVRYHTLQKLHSLSLKRCASQLRLKTTKTREQDNRQWDGGAVFTCLLMELLAGRTWRRFEDTASHNRIAILDSSVCCQRQGGRRTEKPKHKELIIMK